MHVRIRAAYSQGSNRPRSTLNGPTWHPAGLFASANTASLFIRLQSFAVGSIHLPSKRRFRFHHQPAAPLPLYMSIAAWLRWITLLRVANSPPIQYSQLCLFASSITLSSTFPALAWPPTQNDTAGSASAAVSSATLQNQHATDAQRLALLAPATATSNQLGSGGWALEPCGPASQGAFSCLGQRPTGPMSRELSQPTPQRRSAPLIIT